ncbi:Imm1 family immunity protein, partial [Actinoalloteichus caeruleus]|uniref:Imm1 family immunity protein n=1 Tax=Actinoalloteichus cyanogriseus TaxID=2893586 RepID=UPI001B802F67
QDGADLHRRESEVNIVSAVVDNDWRYATTPAERDALARLVVDEPHPAWASLLYVWSHRVSDDGRGPDWQLRVFTDPARGVGALNWVGPVPTNDPGPWDSLNPTPFDGEPVDFDPSVPLFFPPSASLPIEQVRQAVTEYFQTGRRPECVQWQPGMWY